MEPKKTIKKFNKNIPACINGKNHKWKGSNEKYKESGICIVCGYDYLDNCYRRIENGN